MRFAQIKKLKGQVFADMRTRVGASKQRIQITANEWEAISAGAISNSLLSQILNNADLKAIQDLATPRAQSSLSPSKLARARIYQPQGRSLAEIADMLGVSTSLISQALSK